MNQSYMVSMIHIYMDGCVYDDWFEYLLIDMTRSLMISTII